MVLDAADISNLVLEFKIPVVSRVEDAIVVVPVP